MWNYWDMIYYNISQRYKENRLINIGKALIAYDDNKIEEVKEQINSPEHWVRCYLVSNGKATH